MRAITCALVVVLGLGAGTARADVSKAWAAAKDNLPGNTQIFVAVDVAALAKLPMFGKVLAAVEKEERDLDKAHKLITKACGWDPITVIEGVVIAGDPTTKKGLAVYVQLSIDRAKASTCLEAMLRDVAGTKEKITIKQDGKYTVASAGTRKDDTAYFPWVAPNVVMIVPKPDDKSVVDAWHGQKTFSTSPVAALLGKVDQKALVGGAFATDKPDAWVPVTKAYGTWTNTAGKLTWNVLATFPDAKTATSMVDDLTKEVKRTATSDKPASYKKLWSSLSLKAAGAEVTMSSTATDKDLADALDDLVQKKKDDGAMSDREAAEAVAKMDQFAGKMCACKDKACADKVQDDLTKWASEMAKKGTGNKPSEDLVKKSSDIMKRYADCMTKLLTKK
jgi:hypothetical protein